MNGLARFRPGAPLPGAEHGPATVSQSSGFAVELAVVIPTLNERENVTILVDRLDAVLSGIRWEAIFVDDDSPDGTADALREIGRRRPHIRCIRRCGRRGLAAACIEGALAATAPYIAVMDADLQHDEALLPQLLATIKNSGLDIVIASRYLAGGDLGDWQRRRVILSEVAGRLGRLVVKAGLSDPMSGFFMIRSGAFAAVAPRLSGRGFKILLDIFASAPQPLAFAELPYRFRRRAHGASKLDARVGWEYLALLLDKLVGRVIFPRFLQFAAIGGVGLLTHLAILRLALGAIGMAFAPAQAIATVAAMTGNFLLNNIFTYSDRRLRGPALKRGLIGFYGVCAIGAAANVALASHLFAGGCVWWLAGIAGGALGAVSNYALSSALVWRRQRHAEPPPPLPASAARLAAAPSRPPLLSLAAD